MMSPFCYADFIHIYLCMYINYKQYLKTDLPLDRSRLTVVSREAKKGQSDRHARRTTECLLHKQTFSSYDIIITVDISRAT